jgi:hypothetical protein
VSAVIQTQSQPWLYSRGLDGALILAPAWLVSITLLAFPNLLSASADVSPLTWLVLIVCVDVAHVYSTLYRTYFDRNEFDNHKTMYVAVPLLSLCASIMLYSLSERWFWTLLAYVAVFHFVRQQYGLLMLYSRSERTARWMRYLDKLTIYLATLYPLIYWHTHLPSHFQWFVEGDFIALPRVIDSLAKPIYIATLVAYIVKELMRWRAGVFNVPKQLLVFGTVASWYVGIVISKGDLGFTFANVVAHGIPYMALIWIYGANRQSLARRAGGIFSLQAIPVFVGLLIAVAYFEEAIWDGLVWRDHPGLFAWAWSLPHINEHVLLSIIVPLLTLPQLTHYVLDGFIWRFKHQPDWAQTMFFRSQALAKQP